MEESRPNQGRNEPHDVLNIARSLRIPLDVLSQQLDAHITHCLGQLAPALIVYDVTKEDTSFFLNHRDDLGSIHSFIQKGIDVFRFNGPLSPDAKWYLEELRIDLGSIVTSDVFQKGKTCCSRFSIHNYPSKTTPLQHEQWHLKTVEFIKRIRPILQTVLKERYIDDWLQKPLSSLNGLSPIQVIEQGAGERILAIIEAGEVD